MPAEMLDYVKQWPVLAVSLGVVYIAWKHAQSLHNRYLESLDRSHANHLASQDAEIQRLRDDLETARKERDKLQKMLATKEKS